MAKIKKSFRLSSDVVDKIADADNESTFVEQAIRRFNPKEEVKELPKAEIIKVIR